MSINVDADAAWGLHDEFDAMLAGRYRRTIVRCKDLPMRRYTSRHCEKCNRNRNR